MINVAVFIKCGSLQSYTILSNSILCKGACCYSAGELNLNRRMVTHIFNSYLHVCGEGRLLGSSTVAVLEGSVILVVNIIVEITGLYDEFFILKHILALGDIHSAIDAVYMGLQRGLLELKDLSEAIREEIEDAKFEKSLCNCIER